MPVVFVHGVPETAAIWEPLSHELDRTDVITLSPPGFGAAVPDGFGATADEYFRWLVAELERIEGPIDLVGHDWGGCHVQRVAGTRPDLVRSWCNDVSGCTDPDYVWHDLARTWQTPGAGEAAIEQMFGTPFEELVSGMVALGMTAKAAEATASADSVAMGRCILALYRSAPDLSAIDWGIDLPREQRKPGLVINATEDLYVGGPEFVHRAAERLAAKEVVLEGLGHWWMMQDPKRGAAALNDFYADLDNR
ncbi:alpha/beta fold hydrolase [Amycolatopsis umgeniensis]|uniref:Pimeloyl-ACP methyl ester carboxylesterase n=1 Tax=Amycolatopsis umgeniensis TaxID=336628 RepID=A0A841AXK1_9PSEU|nr:alpha/beta hydrolase [Amycolatopsis umgeniensis]MBB5851240.1 pimeloyl-ACP methyl ester carboxylesterase [Amycolatopsis umgeniensis]